jgi:hypothetical protein
LSEEERGDARYWLVLLGGTVIMVGMFGVEGYLKSYGFPDQYSWLIVALGIAIGVIVVIVYSTKESD